MSFRELKMINNTNFEKNTFGFVRQKIDEVITDEEKGLIAFSGDEKEAMAQRLRLVHQLLPTAFSETIPTHQLQQMIDVRRNLETLNLAGREDIVSLKDVWIPPSVKAINLEGCVNLVEICATPAHVKGLKLAQTAVRDFRALSDTVCELDLRRMQEPILWSSFNDRTPDNPLDILINMRGERALYRIPDRINIMFKYQEPRGLNLYIDGGLFASKEFIYLQEFIYTDPALIAHHPQTKQVLQKHYSEKTAHQIA